MDLSDDDRVSDHGRPRAYLDNPAGTQVPQGVIEAVARCLGETNANLGGAFSTSKAADAVVRGAHAAMADLLGAFSGIGSAIGGLAGGMESKSSVVTMSVFDIRSQVQIAASEGSSTATNYGAAAAAFGGGSGGAGSGALGGISTTPECKATVAAFLDAYNGMVVALNNYKAQDVKGGLGRGGRLKVN